ncbi:MAG TPA: S41 family peptidase [Blastocatellia bacterium]|nr:S41 family peptidase [Blastocatellia bacterium]
MFVNRRAPFARLAFALLLLLAIVASPGLRQLKAASNSAVDHSQVGEKLSRHDREEIFEDVWETIDEKYFDPSFNGVDWKAVRKRYSPLVDAVKNDDEFYALMKKMVGELHDAHTRFNTPRERRDREQLRAVSTGVSISEVEGQIVITGVEPNSEAATAGIENGMLLRTVDGKPVQDRIRETQKLIGGTSSERAEKLRLYGKLLDGEPGTTIKLGLEDAEEKLVEVTLTRHVVADDAKVTSHRLASGYSYIKLTLWKSPVHKDFRRALELFKHTPGIIIDLRGNPGGEANEVIKIASYFFNSRVPFGQFISRSGKAITLFTERDEQVYKGAVVILVNEGSGSGSELFSGVMQENGRATIIGRQSCGCVLGITRFKKMEGGSELAVSELKYISPRGQKFEGAGIMPDKVVALTIADLQGHRDAAIQAAESLLKLRKQA